MLVHKYYVRPVDEQSEQRAIEEIERYVWARNRMLDIARKWTERIKSPEQLLPEWRVKAAEIRATPRTGRKPTKERDDRLELRAAEQRDAYAEFVGSGGSYATWWLAEAAAKKAKHRVRDPQAGRAGMLPQWLKWEGTTLHYGNTSWTVKPRMLRQRPIPEQARVAQAWLQRERTSISILRKPRYRWFCIVVLDDVSPRMHAVAPQRTAAGLDIGWRQDDDTLRVAYVADDSGEHRPIRMLAVHYQRLQHAESIQALADSDANILRGRFRVPANTSHRRLAERAGILNEKPSAAGQDSDKDDQASQNSDLETPSAVGQAATLGTDATEQPVPDNAALAEHMVHLLQWHHGQRRNAIAGRDAHYLAEAHSLLSQHHTIYVEDIKGTPKMTQKRSTRRKTIVDSYEALLAQGGVPPNVEGGVARDQRQMVAPFTFLQLLKREAGKFGTEIVVVPAAYTSRVCAACGTDMGANSKGERTCSECGQKWDVDHLAAINLLAWGKRQTASGDASPDTGASLAIE